MSKTPFDFEMQSMNQRPRQPLVSVIVPLYNGAAYIADALQSITNQTTGDLEIIVVDDGSQDRGATAVQEVNDGRIRYLFQPNAGTASARNVGVRASHGRYLAFLDQDDLWLPGKLTAQFAVLAHDETIDLLLGHVWQAEFPQGVSAFEALVRPGRRFAGYLPSTMLVRRAAFLQVGYFSEAHGLTESFDWFVRAREHRLRQAMLEEIVAVRRIHHANKGIQQRHARGEYAQVLKASLDRRRIQMMQLSQSGWE